MKVSKNWLKELVDLKVSFTEVERLLPLRTIGTKEITDDFIELDMKGYNRADLLSMRGVALEIAAITDSSVTFKEANKFIWEDSILPKTIIEVEDKKDIPVYCIAKIEGLKVEKSSKEWVEKLEASGVRSIDCITDVTNLVMLEYGQPMHAFDAKIVADETLIARHAKDGEELTTLDEKTRKLVTSDLVITDPKKVLGIAGVMGGKNSEISEKTVDILFEAAIFDPITIRKTVTRLGLQSEASKRFQHGLTKKRCLQALDSAIKMYASLGGKLTAISIVGDLEDTEKTITLRKSQMDSLIGIEMKEEDVENYLQKLNFKIIRTQAFGSEAIAQARRGDALRAWEVKPPYYRLDISIEADVIEEITRMYGYEKLPSKELAGTLPEKIDQSLFEKIFDLKENLVKIGLSEVQTYSFYSTSIISNFEFRISNLIKILNPMSSETEYMRTHLWPNLVEVVAKNYKQGYKDIAIFEIGKTYQITKSGEIQEEYKLCIALLNGSDNPTQELYQILKTMEIFKLGDPIGESDGRFHPMRYFYVTDGNKPVGKIGEVHLRITDKFGLEKRVAILEIKIG
ncbi:MAG: phenylalanine--tRNA ligase subunit beta [Candidatus Daviesbacteria bacterium]|nr:phenylalanine--tRNA ligase subunit beta [Candidatus Daviesbacteria bacterium]